MWCRSASYALFNRFAVRKLFQNDFCLNADEEGEGVDERGMQKIFTPTSCQRCMCIRQWAGIKKLKKAQQERHVHGPPEICTELTTLSSLCEVWKCIDASSTLKNMHISILSAHNAALFRDAFFPQAIKTIVIHEFVCPFSHGR